MHASVRSFQCPWRENARWSGVKKKWTRPLFSVVPLSWIIKTSVPLSVLDFLWTWTLQFSHYLARFLHALLTYSEHVRISCQQRVNLADHGPSLTPTGARDADVLRRYVEKRVGQKLSWYSLRLLVCTWISIAVEADRNGVTGEVKAETRRQVCVQTRAPHVFF